MARDKPDGREMPGAQGGRERVDDHGGDLRERLRAVETLATDTAHLASTSAFRFGGYAASKGLVYFVSGDLRSAFPADGQNGSAQLHWSHPRDLPRSRSLGNSKFMMLLLNGWLALLLMGLLGQTTLRLQGCWKRSLGGGVSVEAANHGDPLDGKPWPVIITYRGSEDSQRVKDAWLAEALRGHLGPGKEVRPARYLPGGAHKRVLEHLPNKGRGKAGQRRSPKRESEHRGGSERGKHPRVGA